MTMGVGLFGTLASFLANKLLSPRTTDTPGPDTKAGAENEPLSEIRDALREQTRQNGQLQQRLDRIEQQLNEKPPGGA